MRRKRNMWCPTRIHPGALLFGLIINDIHIPLTDADIILYADDTVLYCAGKNSNEIEHLLNNELQKVADWLDENKLFINLKKKEN